MSDPIRVTETCAPVASWKTKYGTTIFDFGCNLVGWTKVVLRGAEGQRVFLRHAEELDSRDSLATENLRSALCTDTIILREGKTSHEPKFTYHGFRYVEVRGKVEVEAIEACFVHDDVAATGTFTCSNDLVNRIVEAAARGIRGNYRSMPTDCPQRDERMGWLGDRAGGAPGEMFLFDVSKLYRKWMDDIRLAQAPNGCVPDVAPPFWRMFSDNVTWPSCMVFLPHWLHRHYGDPGTAERNYEAMRKWLDHLSDYLDEGLIGRDVYGDWCVPPESPHLIHSEREDRKTHPTILASCYLARSLEFAAGLAEALGHKDDANKWREIRGEIREALNARFFDEARACYDNGSQTAALLPLAFGLAPEAHRKRIFEFLVSRITESGAPVLGTGLVGGHWLLRTLTAFGRPDIARDLVTREEYPGWGYMVKEGATTIWELWNGNTADPLMNSGNHVMLLGDLLTWLFEDVAGIQPLTPGFSEVRLRPHFLFDEVRCSHRSIHGPIESGWKIANNKVAWEVALPPNTTARIELPASVARSLEHDGGTSEVAPVVHSDGPFSMITLSVGPGRHSFRFDEPEEFASGPTPKRRAASQREPAMAGA
jgi:alpha-L-rhamnosidase